MSHCFLLIQKLEKQKTNILCGETIKTKRMYARHFMFVAFIHNFASDIPEGYLNVFVV